MEWIKCSERMPDCESLLARGNWIFIGYWIECSMSGKIEWELSDYDSTRLSEEDYPTHWMPLPPVPLKDEK